jgi:hypothetical protein
LTGRNFTGKPLLLLLVSKSFEMLTFECNYRICPNLNISWKLPVLQKKRVTCEDCGQSLRDKYVLKKLVSTFQLILLLILLTGTGIVQSWICEHIDARTILFWAVLRIRIRIRIHRIHMFLGLLDPDLDPSIAKQI